MALRGGRRPAGPPGSPQQPCRAPAPSSRRQRPRRSRLARPGGAPAATAPGARSPVPLPPACCHPAHAALRRASSVAPGSQAARVAAAAPLGCRFCSFPSQLRSRQRETCSSRLPRTLRVSAIKTLNPLQQCPALSWGCPHRLVPAALLPWGCAVPPAVPAPAVPQAPGAPLAVLRGQQQPQEKGPGARGWRTCHFIGVGAGPPECTCQVDLRTIPWVGSGLGTRSSRERHAPRSPAGQPAGRGQCPTQPPGQEDINRGWGGVGEGSSVLLLQPEPTVWITDIKCLHGLSNNT